MNITIDSKSVVEALPLVFIILIALCIIGWIVITAENNKNKSMPTMRAHAVLLEKSQNAYEGLSVVNVTTFQLDDGSRVQLSCQCESFICNRMG